MNIKKYVYNAVIDAIRDCDYEPEMVSDCVEAYIKNNGFYELDGRFNDSVIQRVVGSNLAPVLAMSHQSIAIFFSFYPLIEQVKLINNKSLALAAAVRDGHSASLEEVQSLEAELDACVAEVCKSEKLHQFLNGQISEILLNIDYAKGVSTQMGQRLCVSEGIIK